MSKSTIQSSNPKKGKQNTEASDFRVEIETNQSSSNELREPSKGFKEAIQELDSGKGEYFKSIDDFEASWK